MEVHKEKGVEKSEKKIMKRTNICLIGVPRKEERERSKKSTI